MTGEPKCCRYRLFIQKLFHEGSWNEELSIWTWRNQSRKLLLGEPWKHCKHEDLRGLKVSNWVNSQVSSDWQPALFIRPVMFLDDKQVWRKYSPAAAPGAEDPVCTPPFGGYLWEDVKPNRENTQSWEKMILFVLEGLIYFISRE